MDVADFFCRAMFDSPMKSPLDPIQPQTPMNISMKSYEHPHEIPLKWHYPPVTSQFANLKMAMDIVVLPMKNDDFPVRKLLALTRG